MRVTSRHPAKTSAKSKRRPPRLAKSKAPPKATPKHLDYDLKPLEVDTLSHYVEPPGGSDRFRVH